MKLPGKRSDRQKEVFFHTARNEIVGLLTQLLNSLLQDVMGAEVQIHIVLPVVSYVHGGHVLWSKWSEHNLWLKKSPNLSLQATGKMIGQEKDLSVLAFSYILLLCICCGVLTGDSFAFSVYQDSE